MKKPHTMSKTCQILIIKLNQEQNFGLKHYNAQKEIIIKPSVCENTINCWSTTPIH